MIQDKRQKLTEERLPPYVSYRLWQSFLAKLKGFMPSRFDPSYFEDLGISGSGRSMLRGTLLFFGLITPHGAPTERLRELVSSNGDTRPKLLQGIVHDSYAPLLGKIDLAHASRGQIREYLKSEGMEGDIARKCWSFFRSIAAEAGMQLSPHLGRSSGRGKRLDNGETQDAAGRRPVKGLRIQRDFTWERALLDKFPDFNPEWPDDMKKKWFDDFQELSRRLDMATAARGSRTKAS